MLSVTCPSKAQDTDNRTGVPSERWGAAKRAKISTKVQNMSERKKVAVVLSGGGAKGVAHIGALKVIEDAGIPIDMIVGTSMGSIVGGLYSIGYTPDQLDSMVMNQDWAMLLSDRQRRSDQTLSERASDAKYIISLPFGKNLNDITTGGFIQGSNLRILFNDLMVGYCDSTDFNRLPIPFACVAANIVNGEEVVFHHGVLPTALRASMAIPGAFTPVYTDDMVLVDGGVLNNFPTDVALRMGADVIIGVDVQSDIRSKEELHSAPAVLGQIVELAMKQRTYQRNVQLADVYVKVDVSGYTSASFNQPALDTLIRRGYEATFKEWNKLDKLKEKIGIDDSFETPSHGPYLALSEIGKFPVYNISFGDISARQKKWVMLKSKLYENSEIDVEDIRRCMAMLNATESYTNVSYTMTDTLDGYNLRFSMEQVKGNEINMSVNFDTEEIASVLLNGTMRLGRRFPSKFSFTGRFGKRIMAQADLLLYPGQMNNFNLTYTFQHNDIYVNDGGKKLYNPTYNYNEVNVGYNNMNFIRQNLLLTIGLKYERFSYRSGLYHFDHEGDPIALSSQDFVSYYANVLYENLDNRYFPQHGTTASVGFDLYTDDFIHYRGHSAFSALALSWYTAIPLTSRFSLTPSLYGRVISGSDIPFWYLNMVGGKSFGRYMLQQMPFDGIGYMESVPHSFIAAKIKCQQRIGRRHYLMASFNFGMAENRFFHLLEGNQYYGTSVDYGYDSRLGPLLASLGWSNITRSLSLYLQLGYTF
jgi:NTE family protein